MGDVGLIEIVDLENDLRYTPISCRGSSKKEAISVEEYAEHKERKLTAMVSLLQTIRIIDLSEEEEEAERIIDLSKDEEDEVVEIKQPTTPFRKKPFTGPSVTETGQSSNSDASMLIQSSNPSSSMFICEICVEPKSQKEFFSIKGCTHGFCSECMVKYVASKIQENITSIRCPEPNCEGVLEPEFCHSILPPEVFDRWGKALCESLILGSEKIYCPYKDCSALLVDDGEFVIKETECPDCRRLFCAQCKVPWHSGIECEEFQKLNEDERGREDIMVMELAKKSNWQRCRMCKFYVERSQGCLFMKCRCGFTFCYNCGNATRDHYCPTCKH